MTDDKKTELPTPSWYVSLPEPWVDVPWQSYSSDERDALSQWKQERKNFETVLDHFNEVSLLYSKYSLVSWHIVKNVNTGTFVVLGVKEQFDEGPNDSRIPTNYDLVALYFFSEDGFSSITGTDLRDIPVRTICNAYAQSSNKKTIALNRSAILIGSSTPKHFRNLRDFDALSSLPAKYSRHGWFYALVGYQYDQIKKCYPDDNTVDKMVEINSPAAKSTVQGWITKARKMNLLAPASWVK